MGRDNSSFGQNDRSFSNALDRLGATLPQKFDTIDFSRGQNLLGMGGEGVKSRKKLEKIQLRNPQDIIKNIERDFRRDGTDSKLRLEPKNTPPFIGFQTLDTTVLKNDQK